MDGTITIGTELDTKEFDMQIQDLERKAQELENTLNIKGKGALDEKELFEARLELERVRNKLVQVNAQKQKLQDSKGMKSLVDGIHSFGDGLSKAVTRAGRLALGIFGIRSAYLALRRASSDLASYDEEYATKLEYIRYVLTQAIAPVLRYIVELTMKALQVINMIMNALFGINLFANGSAESFSKMKASAGGVSKAVKEIKKQLMGFDEINMLTSQSDTGTSAGAGGVGMPNMDLSKIEGETPKWMQWIKDYGQEVAGVLGTIFGLIASFKVGKLLKTMGLINKIKPRVLIGIGIAMGGIAYAVASLIKYLKNPTWENFGKIIIGVGAAILGVGVAIASVPVVVAGALTVIMGLITKYWDKIRTVFQNGINWLTSKADWVRKHLTIVGEGIYNTFVNLIKFLFNHFNNFFTSIKNIFDGIIKFVKGVFTKDWNMALEGINRTFDSYIQYFTNKITNVKNLVWNTIMNIWNTITGVVSWIWDRVKWLINMVIYGINKIIEALNKIKFQFPDWIPGDLGGRSFGINIPYVPYMMKAGGILNVPNKGTLVGGGTAIAGEAGREGYLPLTNEQAMSELGREIGKNVIINASIVNTMNGRVISRELKQVQNEQEFAYNM